MSEMREGGSEDLNHLVPFRIVSSFVLNKSLGGVSSACVLCMTSALPKACSVAAVGSCGASGSYKPTCFMSGHSLQSCQRGLSCEWLVPCVCKQCFSQAAVQVLPAAKASSCQVCGQNHCQAAGELGATGSRLAHTQAHSLCTHACASPLQAHVPQGGDCAGRTGGH